jgi:hypothetical protein
LRLPRRKRATRKAGTRTTTAMIPSPRAVSEAEGEDAALGEAFDPKSTTVAETCSPPGPLKRGREDVELPPARTAWGSIVRVETDPLTVGV